ncbi:DEAD/DEAH box helicase [Streptomyces olivaceus]|uniref:DEAD/DEAH box helicase n=1 Tax=Streptomyces olivaceus TaxID=47716 RepID=UPI001CC8FB07|nr:DEAD/DEAH box helicase [Streptomyces olivaceus]MBZ6203872.1 DEAD/DEAH box helicase [Streptomyces olivaceus]MBZ6322928.1 DEAD/DEAH box helicase [Streptomyces olivaceus]
MTDGRVVSAAARKFAGLARDVPAGLTEQEFFLRAVREIGKDFPRPRVAKLIAEALGGGLLVPSEGNRLRHEETPEPGAPESGRTVDEDTAGDAAGRGAGDEPCTDRRALRAVAIDVESVVRTTATAPYVERHVYQVAAVRFGADTEWVAAGGPWQRHLRFPGDGEELRDPRVREAVTQRGVPAEQAWAELRACLRGADAVVAHNGTELDFPVVSDAAQRSGIEDPLADLRLVDALYLAHALWPTASSHRLHDLAREAGVPMEEGRSHTADGDADLLARLLAKGAVGFAGRAPGLRDLVADVVGGESPAWRLLWELAEGRPYGERVPLVWEQADVAALLGGEFAQHPPRRIPGTTAPGRRRVEIPDGLRGPDGRVDPTALARVVHGAKMEPRPAQQRMTEALHDWTDRGVSGLLEAPTGTGKSYAVLAAALDWLAGGDDRTAVVATYTKQLQGQMAKDLHDLEKALPGLLQVSDLVKGQANRLSLAALTKALADATHRTRQRATGRSRPFPQPRFRELVVLLVLRLLAARTPPQSWTARSVDTVDLPAFFTAYAGRGAPLSSWLAALSQRDGEYGPGAGTPLSAHTDSVREAIGGHRLLLANHALVLSHLDDLRAVGPGLLLVVDEAHELENAATSALTTAVDYQDLEAVLAEHRSWLGEALPGPERDRAGTAVGELDRLLDDERLPRIAAQAFDAQAKGVGVRIGSRTTTVASPYSGTSGSRESRRLSRLLDRVAKALAHCRIALERYAVQHGGRIDVLVRERLGALARRTDDLATALDRITADIEAFLAPVLTLDEAPPARVVHLEELAEPKSDLRAYRFRVATSPVDLPEDPEWRRWLASFDRVHYVSATLRVAGGWDFVRSRLGLPEDLPTLALPSPFDLRNQAEVVCFSDFPSWAEQEEGAMRTVAHQLAGFADEMTRRRADRDGFDGGGLVLTTARATAAGIGCHLVEELRSRALQAPVVEAVPLGNGRAYQTFTDPRDGGGFLVGTKGLWQGVDVSDAERLRLVWINKLPFAPFAAPVVVARRAAVAARAAMAGHLDPDGAATEHYYLPLAALQLRQAVGRLIRSDRHRGVVVISDRKLGGQNSLRRSYRRAFLGSLDDGLERPDPETGETGGGNITTMAEGWRRIWRFLAGHGTLDTDRARELCTDDALERHTLLPQTRKIRDLALTPKEVRELTASGTLAEAVLDRCARIGGLLRLEEEPTQLKPAQRAVITAVAEGRNVLGLLPTGFGKSFTFQLPALVLPGVTLVVSPLVALMHDQALELNRSIGGAVRALISPLRESSSRAGKTEVADQLLGRDEHRIRLVYVSPERLCQRRFRETVREAARAGRLTRIAVDEAHTLTQWEDFRPSMRRVGRFLAELRRDHGVAVTAVTATANRAVHEALREGLFALPAAIPAADSDEARAEAARPGVVGGLVTVRENPIRPELAVFRRSSDRLGQSGVAGLVERVVDALEGHAILYCLTVKEVNTLYTHLREYVGDTGVRVLRFHGRLTEAEKSAVMLEFREAPREGDQAFTPVVVVATSAFGLGVNRSDVRTVMCVSPPTDLAALYQQIGRAGRDNEKWGTGPDGPANSGLALATSRGLRMVRFMTGQELPPALLRRMGLLVLAEHRGSFDPAELADVLMNQDAAAGVLTEAELKDRHTQERYRGGVMRAFSALADLGAVEDHGDHPPLCAVKPGDLRPAQGGAPPAEHPVGPKDELERIEQAVIERALSWKTPAQVDVLRLHRELDAHCPHYAAYVDGPAATWELLADLHDRGLLDVSAAPSRRLVTGLTVRAPALPEGYLELLGRRSRRSTEELARLREFYDRHTVCAQRLFADYFDVAELPYGSCGNARCRCSACWDTTHTTVDERRSAVARAFHSPRPRDGGRSDTALREHRVDQQVYRLLQLQPQGMHPRRVWHALRGDDSSYNPRNRRMVALPSVLRDSRHFGGRADLPWAAVGESLARLASDGAATEDERGMWRAVSALRPATKRPEANRSGS